MPDLPLITMMAAPAAFTASSTSPTKSKYPGVSKIFIFTPVSYTHLAKLTGAKTGDTLSTKANPVAYAKTEYSKPYTAKRYKAVNKADIDKISQSLQKLTDEDKTLRVVNDSENRQTLLYGMGEQHLEVIASRLENEYKEMCIRDRCAAFFGRRPLEAEAGSHRCMK